VAKVIKAQSLKQKGESLMQKALREPAFSFALLALCFIFKTIKHP
jgi:hypothetical protein